MRSAEEIGRTPQGPRPVPDLVPGARAKVPSVGRAVLDSGLTVLAVRKPRSPLVEVRLRVPFAGPSRVHAARAELCRRLGKNADARQSYQKALALTRQEPERRFLQRRLAQLS